MGETESVQKINVFEVNKLQDNWWEWGAGRGVKQIDRVI